MVATLVKKILIVRFSSLGDIVMTEPIVRYIQKEYPNAKIDYLTKKAFKPLVECFANINEIYLWDDKLNLLKALRNNNYDLLIDLHDKLNSFIVKRIVHAKQTCTYQKKHFLRKLIIKKLTPDQINSTLNLYFSVFKNLNKGIYSSLSLEKCIASEAFPRLNVKDIDQKERVELFNNFQINNGKTLIGIFPGASYFTKQYPINYWIEFINMIPETWNCQFILLGSYDEKYLAVKIKNACDIKPVDLCGYFNIDKLISFISSLNGVLSNDSGPMHLAAALSKPQIAIFGATHPKLGFKPLNNKAVILHYDIKCQPCSLHGSAYCPKKHFKCMKSIKPGQLFQEFKTMLEIKIWGL